MEEDEFGDLYVDVLVENSIVNANNPSATLTSKSIYEQFDDEDNKLLVGSFSMAAHLRESSSSRRFLEAEEKKVSDLSNSRRLPRHRIDRVDIQLPEVEIRYEHLNVDANVHVRGRALPMLLNYTLEILEGLLGSLGLYKGNKTTMTILHDNLETKEDEFDDGNGEIAVLEPPNETGVQDASVHASVETAENNIQEFEEDNGLPQVNNNIPGIGVVFGGATSIPVAQSGVM
ncbi:hypothetical protein SUGI_0855510 [Cryptomeria japonica]|nr:hypothetical protein SUGI_0855510 [Cryptomeria japonica]